MFSRTFRAFGISSCVVWSLGSAVVLLTASGAAGAQSTYTDANQPVAQSSSLDTVPSGSAYTPLTMASLQGDSSVNHLTALDTMSFQEQAPTTQSPTTATTDNSEPKKAMDSNWHFGVLPYLWFAGAHGTLGARGQEVSVHASPGDLLSNLDIALMGTFEARYKRWILPVDIMWLRISNDKGVPANPIGITYVNLHASQFIMTPKVGYEILDTKKWKVDALVGLRYWHIGEKIDFQGISANFNSSQNFVDVVAGARIVKPLSRRFTMIIAGDAGGGAANSDYQVAGLLGFTLKPKIALQAGWRYLDVNYRPSTSFIYDTAESGFIFGATFVIK
jgi:hypothetical protein